MEPTVDWFVGVDWGMDVHQVCVTDSGGQRWLEREVPHSSKDLVGFADWLVGVTKAPTDHVAVALETPHGSVVDLLVERGFVVYVINPKQVDRFRDRYSMAGAKDDRRDARTLAAALRTDRAAFRRLHVEDGCIVELRELVRIDEDLQRDLNGLANRLREQIYRIQPAWLALSPAADDAWFWAVVARIVRPNGRRLGEAGLRAILRAHRIRRVTAPQVLEVLRSGGVYTAPGVLEATQYHIVSLVARLQIVYDQRRRCERAIDRLLDAMRGTPADASRYEDIHILESLPGVGTRVVATLLTEAARPIKEQNYIQLRACMGLAPVTERSGKRRAPLVHMRRACNHRLRQAAYHWGRVSIQLDATSRRYYDRLRARGQTHGCALRVIVDRWLRILMAMLRDRTVYDATRGQATEATAALA